MTAVAPATCSACTGPAGAPRVTLVCGREVCSWCPDWRAETAAREAEAHCVLRMVDRPTRLRHLETLAARHGAEYRARLEATILDLWNRRRAAAKAQSEPAKASEASG